MDLLNFFKKARKQKPEIGHYAAWQEIGKYNATFAPYNEKMYANELVRSCVRALAEHSSKANVRCVRTLEHGKAYGDQRLEKIIQYRPNMYMNGKDFLYKVRTQLELNNTAFIMIERDEVGKCIGLYPLPTANCEAIDIDGRLYIKFTFKTSKILILNWEDLAVLRKDYNDSDIYGDANNAIYGSLDLLNIVNQGQANAIKSTANLRGILKATKGMFDGEDVKKLKEQFVRDYMSIDNEGGIAGLDSSMEFIPLTLQPAVANYKQNEELRNNIYRYFGVNEEVLTSKAYGDTWEAFYESRIEPFLIALSLELTNKVFTARERGYGNEIIFEANRLAYMSTTAKMQMVQLIDRGILTINEYREILNLAPVEDGDIRLIRKEYAEAQNLNKVQGVGEEIEQKQPVQEGV